MFELDWQLVFQRLIKYLFEGLAVAVAARFLIKSARLEDILILAVTAAAVFAVLDSFAPSVGASSRLGAGAGLGWQLVG